MQKFTLPVTGCQIFFASNRTRFSHNAKKLYDHAATDDRKLSLLLILISHVAYPSERSSSCLKYCVIGCELLCQWVSNARCLSILLRTKVSSEIERFKRHTRVRNCILPRSKLASQGRVTWGHYYLSNVFQFKTQWSTPPHTHTRCRDTGIVRYWLNTLNTFGYIPTRFYRHTIECVFVFCYCFKGTKYVWHF